MSRSLAEADLSRLSPEAALTLGEIAVPLSEGAKQDELAYRLGIPKRDLVARMRRLRQELDDQQQGAKVRPMTEAEYQALRDSIAEHGQLVKAVVDDSGRIVDGHNRARACDELGIDLHTETLGTHLDRHTLELAINFVRRQVTAGDRRRAIAAELTRTPDRSDRSIATMVGASPSTVGTVRRELEGEGRLSNLDSRRGADGRTRPATQTGGAGPESRIDTIIEELRSLAPLQDREQAHARADELLIEAIRLLGGHGVAQAWEQSGERFYAR